MNCKPGDLAIIVAADITAERADLGKLVRVIGAGDDYSFLGDSRQHWQCDTLGQRMTMRCANYFYGTVTVELSNGTETLDFADANMQPIRDPGDHAVDEMIIRTELKRAIPA